MTDLRPCPFCSLPDGKLERYGPRSGWHVVCVYCTAQGPNHGSKEEAVSSWNMRRVPKMAFCSCMDGPNDPNPKCEYCGGMGEWPFPKSTNTLLTATPLDQTNNGVGMDRNGKMWLEHPSNMPGLSCISKAKLDDNGSE
jgi:hypothetical protein